nr:divergent polysaccharide deacetylase family protein [Paenibacillus taihuensis]
MKRIKWTGLCALMTAITLLLPLEGGIASASVTADKQSEVKSNRQVAIVIDDFGNNQTGTPEMMDLPVHITVAVMPFLPTTKQDAELAHKLGHDVIVHMPMEPVRGKPEWLGPGAITTAMSDVEIRKRVEEAIQAVPHAVGMNNHMGSKVTADERVMRVVLSVVKQHGMFFLDSRTTYKTVLPKLTAELGVPLLSNQVFLDDVYTANHVSKQVGIMRRYLESHDSCITIGHVGPPGKITAAVLKASIPGMKSNTTFVTLSQMIVPSAEKDIIPHS